MGVLELSRLGTVVMIAAGDGAGHYVTAIALSTAWCAAEGKLLSNEEQTAEDGKQYLLLALYLLQQ